MNPRRLYSVVSESRKESVAYLLLHLLALGDVDAKTDDPDDAPFVIAVGDLIRLNPPHAARHLKLSDDAPLGYARGDDLFVVLPVVGQLIGVNFQAGFPFDLLLSAGL